MGLTVTVKMLVTVLLVGWLSLTMTVIVALPSLVGTGVKVKLPVPFGLTLAVGLGIRAGLPEVAVTVRVSNSLGAPVVMPLRLTVCCGASWLMVKFGMGLKVGESFTAFTVTRNICLTMLLLGWPSLIVTVIRLVPKALATGVNRRVPVLLALV